MNRVTLVNDLGGRREICYALSLVIFRVIKIPSMTALGLEMGRLVIRNVTMSRTVCSKLLGRMLNYN